MKHNLIVRAPVSCLCPEPVYQLPFIGNHSLFLNLKLSIWAPFCTDLNLKPVTVPVVLAKKFKFSHVKHTFMCFWYLLTTRNLSMDLVYVPDVDVCLVVRPKLGTKYSYEYIYIVIKLTIVAEAERRWIIESIRRAILVCRVVIHYFPLLSSVPTWHILVVFKIVQYSGTLVLRTCLFQKPTRPYHVISCLPT